MNSAYTADLQDRPPESQTIEIGFLGGESYTRRTVNLRGKPWIAKIAGILLPLAVSTITVMEIAA
jgi:hypothetical protein